MKKFFSVIVMAVALFTSMGFTACSDNDDNDIPEVVISYDKLPTAAKTFVETYYPGVEVWRVEKETDKGVVLYDVDFKNGHEVTFDSNGEWLEVDAPDGQSIPSGILPVTIEQYLEQNYSGYGVNDITKVAAGYEVELVSGVDLLFDQDGNFLRFD